MVKVFPCLFMPPPEIVTKKSIVLVLQCQGMVFTVLEDPKGWIEVSAKISSNNDVKDIQVMPYRF